MSQDLPYLAHYPAHLQNDIRQLVDANKLGDWLRSRYPGIHKVANDNDLRDYTMSLKNQYLKKTPPLSKIIYDTPEAFLNMIVVHELAHLKEKQHNKAFYQLCQHMLPEYHQIEFDVRVYLTELERSGTVFTPKSKD